MTDPTLDQALESLTQFAGAPDPGGWSLDGEPFDLAVSVVRDHVADLRDELKAAEASLDGARAAAKTMADVANGLDLDVNRWRDQCPVTAEHVKTAGATPMQALVWARAHGWEGSEVEPWPDEDHGWGIMRLRAPGSLSECDAVIYETDAHGPVELHKFEAVAQDRAEATAEALVLALEAAEATR